MTTMRYRAARSRAVERALANDPDIVLFNGFVNAPFNPDDGFLERVGDRVVWPPISENAVCGLAIGAAVAGLRPMVPIGTSSFMFYGWPQIVNEAANIRYLSGGASSAPVVFHVMAGARRSSGAQHEHTPQSMLQNVPGLHVFAPATPADVDGLLHAAFELEDPVVLIDHVLLSDIEGEVPDTPQADFGRAHVLAQGSDLLIVAYGLMVGRALNALPALAELGIRASVLNLRTISPLPIADVIEAVARHDHVLLLDESRLAGSPASAIAAWVGQETPGKRIRLVCTAPVPSPFAWQLLDQVVPTTARIVDEAVDLLERR